MQKISENIWTKTISLSILGIPLGGQATIVRLSSGELLIYSPVEFSEEDLAFIKDLGRVKYLVAPNAFHHLFMESAHFNFPEATVLASPLLKKKHPDWHWAEWLETSTVKVISDQIELHPILGHGAGEILVYLPKHKALLIADLFFNLYLPRRPVLASVLSLIGMHAKLKSSPLWRRMILDKKLYQESIENIMKLDFEVLVLCHGVSILNQAKTAFIKAWEISH